MMYQLNHRLTGAVIFECNVPQDVTGDLAVRHVLETAAAVRPRITLCQANLADQDLRCAVAPGADFTDANLKDTDLRDADLKDTVLRGAVLRGADLTGADLRDADLRGADLTGADLINADLTGADLRGADLTGADLRYADLRDTDLTGADLTDTDLRGANLKDIERDFDGKNLPRATPEQAVQNLDKVRAIILDNRSRLDMSSWHQDDDWQEKTCAEETLCETTHCLAGWLQVCTTEPELKTVDAQLAGVLSAPVAAKMFFRSGDEVLAWLENREYATACL